MPVRAFVTHLKIFFSRFFSSFTAWVPCPECECVFPNSTRALQSDELLPGRCGNLVSVDSDGSGNETTLRVALKNDCDGTVRELGMVNYATVILFLIANACLGEYIRRQEVQFDEDEQTAQDYSIRISNPPHDATDPEEWRTFFLENLDGAQVSVRARIWTMQFIRGVQFPAYSSPFLPS